MRTNRITHRRIGATRVAGGLTLLLALAPAAATVERADFNRYEVILSRRPFGAAPEEEKANAAIPPPPPPAFAAKLKMVAITDRAGQIRVGFVDSSEKPPKTYFLFVGDAQNGYQVVSADYERETAVLRKDGHELQLSMSAPTGSASSPVTADSARQVSAGARPSATLVSRRRSAPRVLSPGRQARLEERRRRAEIIPELHGQVLEKHLQEYNLQAIRSGAPALPIPLTPEQDAQLVQEGILPPVE